MSADSTFQSTYSTENEFAEVSGFEFSDYLDLDQWLEGNPAAMASVGPFCDSTPPTPRVDNSSKTDSHHQHGQSSSSSGSKQCGNEEAGKSKKVVRDKVAFKTKSDVDIMDDGFRWRKYGKKMVKDSPNPRNYYKCSVDGCPVKKRVERDAEDSQYVITTYEGVHNHESPQL
ncbi:hypothetical protein NE237_029960 [Protea cynaroides]|uniref:WRKY domain-containing protein n=1 Tax=Protea cynaroides TaxID=273540 RepID=A0A9Q0GST5_9MAGN|nr:hypothetical protein NE237_029960 [Protea cynaroides]